MKGSGFMIGVPLKIRELIEEIYRGEVLLPEIQRANSFSGASKPPPSADEVSRIWVERD